ncbi:MAG: hypothetical protein J0H57_26490, partial [Rhodospirillales bacterium]|nr:hypothetical protein [Rhodospirillales bacterium]
AEDCLYPDPETGEPINVSHMAPRSKEDIQRRHRGLARIAEHTVGVMGRTPDYMNVTYAGFAACSHEWAEHGNEALTFLAISFFFTMLGLAWGFGRTPFSTTELLMIFLVWCVLVYCYDLYVFIGLRLTRLGLAWLDSLLTSCYRSMW